MTSREHIDVDPETAARRKRILEIMEAGDLSPDKELAELKRVIFEERKRLGVSDTQNLVRG